MAFDRAIQGGQQLLKGGVIPAVKVPVRMPLKLIPTFISPIQRAEKGHRVRRMDQHRHAQSPGLVPYIGDARIVRQQQLAIRVAVGETQALEHLEAACAPGNIAPQLPAGIIRPLLAADTAPIQVAEGQKPARVASVAGVQCSAERLTAPSR